MEYYSAIKGNRKTVVINKEALHVDKGVNQQEDIILINIYIPNIGAPIYIQQMLTDQKREK